MSHNKAPQARLTTKVCFPNKYFLENLAVRADNSVLLTAMNHHELWYVPPMIRDAEVEPTCLHTFDQPTLAIVEVEPEVFCVVTSNLYTTQDSYLHRVDLRSWKPGTAIRPQLWFSCPKDVRAPNGACLISPGVLLVADSFSGVIWRVNLNIGGGQPEVSLWLKHESMGFYPGKMKPEQPGVNGVRYAARTRFLYYTATAKKLFMRVAVDPSTLSPSADPELVVAGRMGDDFCIDEDAGVIYLATHRQNTIDIISMEPGNNSGFTQSVAGDPVVPELVGPSSGAWGRRPGDYGRLAYFITDGGTASPPPEGPGPARLLRVEFQALGAGFPAGS